MTGNAPFIRYVLCLGAGIVATELFLECLPSIEGYLTPILAILALLIFLKVLFTKGFSPKQPMVLIVLLVSLGGLLTSQKRNLFAEEADALTGKAFEEVLLQVTSVGQKRKTTYQYEANVGLIQQDQVWQPSMAKVLVSVDNEAVELPKPGDFLIAKGQSLNRPRTALNPDQMDYARYLRRRGIAWTMYLPEESFLLIDKKTKPKFSQWPARVSQRADSVLHEYLGSSESYGLVKAMLLGRRDDIGPGLLQSYASAGAIHVLAVSGLHVGVLFLLFSASLGWLKKWRWGRGTYVFLIILLLGSYALITGLSPSVMRASLMCVVLAASQAISRKHHSLNALALSAFIILLLDPLALYSVGFQLSYAAVAGILLVYPLGKGLIHSRFGAVEWIWQISLIGFSAQLFTFPLSVYYFHQFPTYFWLVNPFVILLTGPLIYGALGLIGLGSFPLASPLTEVVAYLTGAIGDLMNYIVAVPGKLPGYLLENLNLSLGEVLLLMVWIFVLYKMLSSRELSQLKRLGAVSLVYLSVSIAQLLTHFTAEKIIFHATPKHTVLSFIKGQKAYILADPTFGMDTSAFDFNLNNYLVGSDILDVKYVPLPDRDENATLSLVTANGPILFDAKPYARGDQVTVIRNKRFPKQELLTTKPTSIYILSQELGFKTREKWRHILEDGKSRVIDPTVDGAYEF